jgi:3-oxoacid CoA-transferase subunit B
VQRIITDLGVIDVRDGALVLRELAPEITVGQVAAATDAELIIDLENPGHF